MKYFIDTEFIEYPCTIDLISIGIVAEDGREYYAISNEYDVSKANNWVLDNVIFKLDATIIRKSKKQIKEEILAFINDTPEFWAYYADYDWVVFCWLFGAMVNLPQGWPMYCNDIKQLLNSKGNPEIPMQNKNLEHNALADAKYNMFLFHWINETSRDL